MSTLGRDVRHGLGIARIELRRSIRRSFGTRKRQLTVLGFLALFSPLVVFWGRIAYSAGRDAVEQGSLPIDVLPGAATDTRRWAGLPPMAAMSLRFTAAAFSPRSRGEVDSQVKWTPSIRRSVVMRRSFPS